jgi:hypothetical protein
MFLWLCWVHHKAYKTHMNIYSYEIYLKQRDEPHEKEKEKMMRNVIENKEKETPFQLFFLKNDETQNVEVVEVNEIDFKEVKRRLERGESVFIKRKQQQKSDINLIAYETVKEPWYLLRS